MNIPQGSLINLVLTLESLMREEKLEISFPKEPFIHPEIILIARPTSVIFYQGKIRIQYMPQSRE